MSGVLIPQAHPGASFLGQRDALLAAVSGVLDSGWYINGTQVRQFEAAFASFCKASSGVGTGNGTDAIELALRALGIGAGDLVFTVSHTAVATVAAVERAGAVPVLVDVDPLTYTMCPQSLEKALAAARQGVYPGKPAAILPVHLYGCCADMDALLAVAQGLPIIEDCAQAHGALYKGKPVGSLGIAGTFSFYPTKNLGTCGDGGCVVTSDAALADRLRSIREYGWKERYLSDVPGINTRLDELHAALLNVLLPELPRKNAARRALAARYQKELEGLPELVLPSSLATVEPVYHLYVVQHPHRDALQARLREKGIGTAVHYPAPVHLQKAYKDRVLLAPDGLPVTERLAPRILSLPMFPELAPADALRVAAAVRESVSELSGADGEWA
ncbi:MAG: DegT/DnrJ/EryC1/StrS family aminotransferase [Bilophila sp.]